MIAQPKNTVTIEAEFTDTFGGEANYSWVKRATLFLPEKATARSVVIAAKKALGLTGTRCRMQSFGDMIELRPVNSCTVAFIHFVY